MVVYLRKQTLLLSLSDKSFAIHTSVTNNIHRDRMIGLLFKSYYFGVSIYFDKTSDAFQRG